MKALVIGAGVVGVTTAYYLTQAGIEVTLVERNSQPAQETSMGNAGLYSPSDSLAWASPGALKTVLMSLVTRDQPIKYRLRFDPRLWRWSWQFIAQCRPERVKANSLRKLSLTQYSLTQLDQLVDATGVKFDHMKRGILYGFRSQKALDHAAEHLQLLVDHGLPLELLQTNELNRFEPSLQHGSGAFAGGFYSPTDHTGDSHKFSQALVAWMEKNRQLQCRWNTVIHRFETAGERISRAISNTGPIAADVIVLATGPEAPLLATPIGVRLPIYPVKGYSMTVPIRDFDAAPSRSVIDEERLIAITRMGDRLRITSTAEFAGFSRSHSPQNFKHLIASVSELFPGAAHYDNGTFWAGLRPMTPTSVPIIGQAKYRNFFVNVGHGHLGWTMSCGAGKIAADLITGQEPDIDLSGLGYTTKG